MASKRKKISDDEDPSSFQHFAKGVRTDDGGRRGLISSTFSNNGGSSGGSGAPSTLNHNTSKATTKGRAVRQKLCCDQMAHLNYKMYEWAQRLLASGITNIPNDAFFEGRVSNYIRQRDEIYRRYNRSFGDVVAFGSGDCGQLGCGESVTEARKPRVLAGLRNRGISMVASGGLHSVAVDNNGTVWTWGCNDEGSLGWKVTEEKEDGALPSSVTGFYPSQYGPNGVTSDMLDDNQQIIPFEQRKDEFITQVAAGETQSLALSSTGNIYTWGTMKDNEGRKFRNMPPEDDKRPPTGNKNMNLLEEDDDPKYYQPPLGNQDWPCHLVEVNQKAKDISAGCAFNAALLEDNTLVTWGIDGPKIGALARPVPELDKRTDLEIVKRVFLRPQPPVWDTPLIKRTVFGMACGGYHLIALTREEEGLRVYSSGLNQYGQLGHGNNEKGNNKLCKVEFFDGKDITKVDAGLQYSCFLDKTGKELYTCGRGDYGQLGNTLEKPDEGHFQTLPSRVPLVYDIQGTRQNVANPKENSIILDNIVEEDQPEIEQISAGDTHVLVLTKGGDAYSWGFGAMGACGQGKDEDDVLRPKKLEAKMMKSQGASTYKFQYVSGGGQHSTALVTSQSLS